MGLAVRLSTAQQAAKVEVLNLGVYQKEQLRLLVKHAESIMRKYQRTDDGKKRTEKEHCELQKSFEQQDLKMLKELEPIRKEFSSLLQKLNKIKA